MQGVFVDATGYIGTVMQDAGIYIFIYSVVFCIVYRTSIGSFGSWSKPPNSYFASSVAPGRAMSRSLAAVRVMCTGLNGSLGRTWPSRVGVYIGLSGCCRSSQAIRKPSGRPWPALGPALARFVIWHGPSAVFAECSSLVHSARK